MINAGEMKFANDDFVADKNYYRAVLSRPERIREFVSRKASVQNTLITAYDLMKNEYSSAFTSAITMENLFVK